MNLWQRLTNPISQLFRRGRAALASISVRITDDNTGWTAITRAGAD